MSEQDQFQELVDSPKETLATEVKQWLDLRNIEHKSKVIKAALALRNFNGGNILIGFKDGSLEPDMSVSKEIQNQYQQDLIQQLISKHSSEQFEVTLEFRERQGIKFPIISIPSGVKTPVACRADLKNGESYLLKCNDIYTRSLNSSNVASSCNAIWKDWENIAQICFDNREADIGRFFRRHLSGINSETMKDLLKALDVDVAPIPSKTDEVMKFLEDSEKRFEEVRKQKNITLPPHGSWQTSLVIDGDVPEYRANKDFLRLLDTANPRHTGWPVWLNSENFSNKDHQPYVENNIWESFISTIGGGWTSHIDFMRIDPKGKFYLYRGLQDDLSVTDRQPEALTGLDFYLPISRMAELLSVSLSFAKVMGCNQEATNLLFSFKWTKLKDREVVSWADTARYISSHGKAYQDEVLSSLSLPLETPLSALGVFVKQAIDPLFEIFNDFKLSQNIFDEITEKTLRNRF